MSGIYFNINHIHKVNNLTPITKSVLFSILLYNWKWNGYEKYIIYTNEALMRYVSKDVDISERTVRAAIKELKDNNILVQTINTINNKPVRGSYLININVVSIGDTDKECTKIAKKLSAYGNVDIKSTINN